MHDRIERSVRVEDGGDHVVVGSVSHHERHLATRDLRHAVGGGRGGVAEVVEEDDLETFFLRVVGA